jgi:hypothetical protein
MNPTSHAKSGKVPNSGDGSRANGGGQALAPTLSAAFKYDKGDRRKKHVGAASHAVVEFDDRQPRKLVGKCPRGLEKQAAQILAKSIPSCSSARRGNYAKHRYAVHEGVIYEAATSDRGETYHGYPYHGKLAKALVLELRKEAAKQSCATIFDKWVDDHIEYHGSWAP